MNTNDVVFALLKEALFGYPHTNLESIVDEGLWNKVFGELSKQSVLGLTSSIICNHRDIPESILESWGKSRIATVKKYVQEAFIQNEACKIIQDKGIDVVVIKGMASAIYYPIPELREMGDVDLLVRPENYEEAIRSLRENNYVLIGKEGGQYHTVFKKNEFIVELHRSPAGIHRHKKGQTVRNYILSGMDEIETNQNGRYEFPILPWKQNGMELIWHINQHLYNGLGLRQILDWMMFVNCTLDDERMKEFMPDLRKCGLDRLAVVVTKMCQKYLGLPQENFSWCDLKEDSVCDNLMNYIMEQGNFGIKTPNEKVAKAVSGYSNPLSMYHKLQEIGKKRWGILKRVPVLEPFAFLYAGIIMLQSAYKEKKTLKGIVQDVKLSRKRIRLFSELVSSSKKHSYIQKAIKLFKREDS